jgi:hypothetical protein
MGKDLAARNWFHKRSTALKTLETTVKRQLDAVGVSLFKFSILDFVERNLEACDADSGWTLSNEYLYRRLGKSGEDPELYFLEHGRPPAIWFSHRDVAHFLKTGDLTLSHSLGLDATLLSCISDIFKEAFPGATAGYVQQNQRMRISIKPCPRIDRPTVDYSVDFTAKFPDMSSTEFDKWVQLLGRAMNGRTVEYDVPYLNGDSENICLTVAVPEGKRLRRVKWFRGVLLCRVATSKLTS